MTEKRRPVTIGMSSLFAVLIVLCLIIFAILAHLTAKSELALAERAAESVTAYYVAEHLAVQRLQSIEGNVGAKGLFSQDIDENRRLRVGYTINEDGVVVTEWVVVRKAVATEEQPNFGEPPKF